MFFNIKENGKEKEVGQHCALCVEDNAPSLFKKVAARRTRTDHAWCYVRSLQPVEETSAPLIFFSPLLFMPRLLVVRLLGIVAVAVVRTQDLLEQDTYKK